jgi:hypothetical protein
MKALHCSALTFVLVAVIAAQGAPRTGAAREIEAKLEVLEAARKAQIITVTEYRAKKAELEAQLAAARAPVLDEATKQKLEILQRAFEAGLLSEAEYASKKAEIEAAAAPAAPRLDADTRAKLAALDAALQAGILSDEEYAKKREELVGGGALPEPPVVAPSPPVARGGSVSYRDPAGRFSFTRLGDWSAKPFPNGQGVLLSKEEATISIMILPEGGEPVALADGILGQIRGQWKGYQEGTRGNAAVAGRNALIVPFSGTNPNGVPSVGRLAVLAHEGQGYVLLLSAPSADAAAVQWAWDTTLRSFELGEVAKAEKHAGKTYRHVIGFSFWYPEGWRVQEHDDFLQIIPPNPGTSPEGPTELYLIVGDTVAGEGITSPKDPRVVQYMEMAVAELSPFVQRTGGIGTVPMSQGEGARIDWKGRNQQGKVVCARTYVCILRESGIALLALAFEENLKRREGELVKIFASFGLGEGERDPQLVGTWGLVSTSAITNTSPFETDYSRARAVSEEQSTLQLMPDGTWIRNDVSEFIAISGGLTVSSGPDRKASRGKWNAAQGSLYLIWDDGSWQDYKYELQAGPQGRRLILTGEKFREAWQGR